MTARRDERLELRRDGPVEIVTPLVDRRPDYDELLRLAEAAPFNAADVPTFPPAADFLRAASPVVVAALIRENRQQAERIAALEGVLSWRASEPEMEEYDAPTLLELVALYMDIRDAADGNSNSTAQTDLRRFATAIRVVLSESRP